MHHFDRMEKRDLCCEHARHAGLAAYYDAVGVDIVLSQKLINKRTGAQFRFYAFNLVLMIQNTDVRSLTFKMRAFRAVVFRLGTGS